MMRFIATFLVLALSVLTCLSTPLIGLYTEPAPWGDQEADVIPYTPLNIYIVASWDTWDFTGGITAAEFKIDNLPHNIGYPTGTVTVNHTTDLIIGDLWTTYSAAWDSPQGSGVFAIASIELMAFDASWITGNHICEVTHADDYPYNLAVVDAVFDIYQAQGGIFTLNGSPPINAFFNLSVDFHEDNGQLYDYDNAIGTDPNATDGYDPDYDMPELPPPPQDYLSCYFEHVEWDTPYGTRFRTDIRDYNSYLDESDTWQMTVETDHTNTMFRMEFYVNWGLFDNLPLTLIDLDQGTYTNITSYLNHEFNSLDGIRHFEIQAGPIETAEVTISPGWSMFSLPLSTSNTYASEIIGDDVNGDYFLYGYQGQGGYYESSNLNSNEGYWLGLNESSTIDATGASLTISSTTLWEPGWHMVGSGIMENTFLEDVLIKDDNDNYYAWSEGVSAGLISSSVYGYEPTTFSYETTTELSPWSAYWIGTLQWGITLIFEASEPHPNHVTESFTPSESAWRVPIHVAGDTDQTATITLGVHEFATEQYDAMYDQPMPPASPNGTRIDAFFEHTDWSCGLGSKFITDVNSSTFTGPLEWTANIVSKDPSPPEMTWGDLSLQVPNNIEIYLDLLDTPEDENFNLRNTKHYSFATSGEHLVKFTAHPSELNDPSVPVSLTQLLPPHPNPFNPSTEITFELSKPGLTSLKVYNVQGRLIDTLVEEYLDAGSYTHTWPSSGRHFKKLSSGAYFAKLVNERGSYTSQLILLK